MATVTKSADSYKSKFVVDEVGHEGQITQSNEEEATVLALLDELIATDRRTLSSLEAAQQSISQMRHVLNVTKV